MTANVSRSPGCRLVGKRLSHGPFAAVFTRTCWILAVSVLFAAPVHAEGECCVMAKLASQSMLMDGAVAGDRIIVVGERGHVLISEDQGESWRQVAAVPTRRNLMGVAFADSTFGFAVGADSLILRTRDGGTSWEQVHLAPEWRQPLFDVLFLDGDSALAVGAYGLILRTDDGGDSWTQEAIGEDDWHLNMLVKGADDGATLFAAAEAGRLYRFRLGEDQWEELPSPYKGSFFGILPLQNQSLIAYGLRGNMFRSDDDGQSWRRIETGSQALLMGGGAVGGRHVGCRGQRRRGAGQSRCRGDVSTAAARRSKMSQWVCRRWRDDRSVAWRDGCQAG